MNVAMYICASKNGVDWSDFKGSQEVSTKYPNLLDLTAGDFLVAVVVELRGATGGTGRGWHCWLVVVCFFGSIS